MPFFIVLICMPSNMYGYEYHLSYSWSFLAMANEYYWQTSGSHHGCHGMQLCLCNDGRPLTTVLKATCLGHGSVRIALTQQTCAWQKSYRALLSKLFVTSK